VAGAPFQHEIHVPKALIDVPCGARTARDVYDARATAPTIARTAPAALGATARMAPSRAVSIDLLYIGLPARSGRQVLSRRCPQEAAGKHLVAGARKKRSARLH